MTEALRLVHRGKVRDLYEVDHELALMVASDRISAYDCVFDSPIPEKGRVLTAMTAYWTSSMSAIAPGSIVSADGDEIERFVPGFSSMSSESWSSPIGRSLLVRRAQMLPIECIVRGYLAGQAFDEYEASGTIHQVRAPEGLRLADRLPEPIFTPSTKAEVGHDINISPDLAATLVGEEVAAEAARISLSLYRRAAARMEAAGLILADTKFELGFIDGELCVCDEVITPDSSRIWPADGVVPGEVPPAFDKQPLRDWAASSGWDKRPPAPHLPEAIAAATSQRYISAYERVTDRSLADWYGAQP